MRVIVSQDNKSAVIHFANGKSVRVSDDQGNVLYWVDHLLGLDGELYLWKMERTQEIKVA